MTFTEFKKRGYTIYTRWSSIDVLEAEIDTSKLANLPEDYLELPHTPSSTLTKYSESQNDNTFSIWEHTDHPAVSQCLVDNLDYDELIEYLKNMK